MYIEMKKTGLDVSDLITLVQRKGGGNTGFPYKSFVCRCSNCLYSTKKDMEDFEKYYDRVDIPISAHPKLAITKRNEWMAEQADLILCYIERESGGAYKAVQYAKKLGKELINLAEETDEDKME